MTLNTLELPNKHEVSDKLISCGLPSAEQVRALAGAGVRTVLSFCQPGECSFDEQRLVSELGMRFVAMPISGPADMTPAAARTLQAVLDDVDAYPMVMHCSTGNRAGGMLAAKLFHCDGLALEQAIVQGRVAGLTKLEKSVRQCLQDQQEAQG
ncbi:hypothetical protein [Gallaecimonas sp. GXIMD4217]|uniref:hypothetical protein n=1 Tax=Gallaecimonas sp. GXIMD4217 TaxID=3131927 RepID=UPI00311AC8E9